MRIRRGRGDVPAWRVPAAKRLDELLALPMLVLTVVFLLVLTLPMVDRHLSPAARSVLAAMDLGIWAAFLAEYLARLFVAPNRLSFIRHNIFDLLLVAIPLLRPLRVMRSVRLIRAARLVRIAAASGRLVTESRVRYASRAALLAAGTAAVLIFAAAVMTFDVEHDVPKANIKTLGDALWWALSTVTTVGYGDRYPVTGEGRAIGAVLMITGVGVFGVIAASAAAWFVSIGQGERLKRQSDAINALTAEVNALRKVVSALSSRITDHATHSEAPHSLDSHLSAAH